METLDSQEATCLSDLIAEVGKFVTIKHGRQYPERLMRRLTRIYDLGYANGVEAEALAWRDALIREADE